MSRRHLINSSDVFFIKGFTVENAKIWRQMRNRKCKNFAKKTLRTFREKNGNYAKNSLVDNKSKKVAKSHEKRLIFENTRLIFKELFICEKKISWNFSPLYLSMQKMRNFAKKFVKCDQKFSHFLAKSFVRWKPYPQDVSC